MNKLYVFVVIPILLLIYFEFFGSAFCKKIKCPNLKFYFPIGFFVILGIIYPLSLLTNNNMSFWLLLGILILLFVISIIFIIKNFSIPRFNAISLLLLLLIVLVLTYYSSQTTLGNLDGFDSIHYLNMVSQNIGLDSLNSKDVYFNSLPEYNMVYYSSEVYYYFASTIVYIFGKIASLFKIEFFYSTCFIWVFQIIFNSIVGALVIEGFDKFKSSFTKILYVIVLVFVFGKLYYNNVFGFFGNSMYTLCLSYITILLIDIIDNNNQRNKYVIYLLLFGLCSLSTSGIYTSLFFLLGLFFITDNTENDYLCYALLICLPISNAFVMERKGWILSYAFPLLLSAFIIFLRKQFAVIFKDKKRKIVLLALLFAITFLLSRKYSNGLFDFSGLLKNNSQRSDMTLNYFSIISEIPLLKIYKIFILVILFGYLILKRKEKYSFFILSLIIVIFNPFSCNFFNRYINVYYRAYDIFLNPFSIFYMFENVLLLAKNNVIKTGITIIIGCLFALNINYFKPLMYNNEFAPSDNYNYFYKMSKDQFDIIKVIKEHILYYDEDNPYIITSNLLTLGMIPKGKYLIGRAEYYAKRWSNSEKRLYEIFYPTDYLGNKIVKNPDYNNMPKYIKEAGIDYIVVDKKEEYYDEEKGIYSFLFYKVSELCNIYPIYENDSFVVFHFD